MDINETTLHLELSSRMAHQRVLLQEDLLYFPAQSQELGGAFRRWTIQLGELDRAMNGVEKP